MEAEYMNDGSRSEPCYICKKKGLAKHFFYKNICTECGDLNYQKRFQEADLRGYTALLTGGRIKIGYETTLKLLRCGATVIVTSRFPYDAGLRFEKEKDFSDWKDRLRIYGLDLRHISSVEYFIDFIINKITKLDIIINNAAQTIRRPPVFYKNLVDVKLQDNSFDSNGIKDLLLQTNTNNDLVDNYSHLLPLHSSLQSIYKNINSAAQLSQIPLMPGDEITESQFFPKNKCDKDGQQVDRRSSNSWILKLEEINLIEFLEVLYINLVSPFLFNSKLKSILSQSDRPSFIINVSAMEGNFHDPEKKATHAHTNMAKAALNMMTRTSAMEYAKDSIFMNSVDVGYITNEKPFPLDFNENEKISKLAIDEIDGASRILDPIFMCINHNERNFGNLYKNYSIYPW